MKNQEPYSSADFKEWKIFKVDNEKTFTNWYQEEIGNKIQKK